MTKQKIGEVQRAMEAAMAEVAGKFGVQIRAAGGTFDEAGATLKFKVEETGDAGLDGKRALWTRYCGSIGFTPDAFGKEFSSGGNVYEICGIQISRKRPILAKNRNGKVFQFDAFDVSRLSTLTETAPFGGAK